MRAACLVELKKSAELFAFAHALVDAYPQSWTAWYAVGCYYYLIGELIDYYYFLNKLLFGKQNYMYVILSYHIM